MKKILSIHLLSTNKFVNTRQKNCAETWLSDFNDYVFTTDILGKKYKEISHTEDSSYPYSCNIKQLKEMIRIIDNKLYNEYEWFFFGDDDVVLNINKLISILKNPDSLLNHLIKDEKQYEHRNYKIFDSNTFNYKWGVFGSLASLGPGSVYPSGGAGFFIHGDVFKNCKFKPDYIPRKYVDVLVGDWMKKNNIPLYWVDGMTGCAPYEPGIDPKNAEQYDIIRQNWLTFHRIHDYETMKLFDDIWKNKI